MQLLTKRNRLCIDILSSVLLLLGGALAEGCCGGDPPPPFSDGIEDPPLDPRGLFETQVKPQLEASCSCHQVMQAPVGPFWSQGSAYSALTAYRSGLFLTAMAEQSLLLTKGAHQGPAFSQDQSVVVQAWLQGESLSRGKNGGTSATPSVAIRTGDFYISLDSLTLDPLARISFTLAPLGVSSYRVQNLQLTAGPTAGIHIKHPRFIIYSGTRAIADPGDVLGTVDISTGNPSATVPIGPGSLMLTQLPASSARLALVFDQIDKVNPGGAQPQCTNYAAFNTSVKNRLSPCASQCHSSSGSDLRWSQATGAFDMSAALGIVDADTQQLCAQALGRLDLADLSQSALLLQLQPPSEGGTLNHPYKLDTPTKDFAGYKLAITSWGQRE